MSCGGMINKKPEAINTVRDQNKNLGSYLVACKNGSYISSSGRETQKRIKLRDLMRAMAIEL